MSETFYEVTPGTGLKLRTDMRNIGAVDVHQQFVLPGEPNAPTYAAKGISVSLATSADHLLIIQGDGGNYARIRRITIRARTAGTAGNADIRVYRVSTAGTGGTTVNARPFDSADTNPYAGVCMTLPTAKGTEGDELLSLNLPTAAAAPSTGVCEWKAGENNQKPIIIGTAVTDGIAVKIVTGIATVTADVEVEFTTSVFR